MIKQAKDIVSIESYLGGLIDTLQALDQESIDVLVANIFNSLTRGGTVAVCGNGGSFSTAQHFACDVMRRLPRFSRCGKVIALGTNLSFLTATANDISYADIFSNELEFSMTQDNWLLCLSFSSKSENILNAIKKAKELGGKVALLTGNIDDETFRRVRIADLIIKIPSSKIHFVEDIHHAICHYISESVIGRLVGEASLNQL